MLGRISHEIGWKQKEVLERLEAKRKAQSAVYHDAKKAVAAKVAKAKASHKDDLLAKFGY